MTVATVAVASCFCCCSHDHKKVVTSLCASLLQTAASPDVFPTPVHAGFGQTFSEVWPDIEAALEELVVVNMTASQASLSSHLVLCKAGVWDSSCEHFFRFNFRSDSRFGYSSLLANQS